MDSPLPPQYYRTRPQKSSLGGTSWQTVTIFIVILAGAGWAFYNFYWVRRLPQERVLTDRQGHQMQTRIEGRYQDLLKLTWLNDGTAHVISIADLSDEDQRFARALRATALTPHLFEFIFSGFDGNPVRARVEGRSEKIIKVTFLPGDSVHYYAIGSLSKPDQDVMRQMGAYLQVDFPLDCTLTDSKGRALKVIIIGRTKDVVTFIVANDQTTHEYLIANLSAGDQAMLNALPINLHAPTSRLAPSAEVQNLRMQLIELLQQYSETVSLATKEGISTGEHDRLTRKLRNITDQMTHCQAAITADYESRMTKLQKDNVEIETQLGNPGTTETERISLREKIKANNDMIKALHDGAADASVQIGQLDKPHYEDR